MLQLSIWRKLKGWANHLFHYKLRSTLNALNKHIRPLLSAFLLHINELSMLIVKMWGGSWFTVPRCIIDLFLDTRTFSPLGAPRSSVCGCCHSDSVSVNSQMLHWIEDRTTEPFIEGCMHNTHTQITSP